MSPGTKRSRGMETSLWQAIIKTKIPEILEVHGTYIIIIYIFNNHHKNRITHINSLKMKIFWFGVAVVRYI